MVDFYVKGSDFNIKIDSRPSLGDLEKYLKHIGLIPPTGSGVAYDTPVKLEHIKRIILFRHLYSLFNLDSHLYLPIQYSDVMGDINRLDLPIGALVAIDSPLPGTNLRDLSRNIARHFSLSYNIYAAKNLRFKLREDDKVPLANLLMKNFMRDQSNMLDVIRKKAYEKIVLGRYLGDDIALNLWYYESVVSLAQKDFNTLRPTTDANLRKQCEKFALSQDYSTTLVFEQLQDPLSQAFGLSISFKLRLTQDDLMGITYNVYSNVKISASDISNLREDMLRHKNKETVQLLEQAILNIESGRAKLIPMVNTRDSNLGYQFFKPRTKVSGLKYTFLPKWPGQPIAGEPLKRQPLAGMFDIDLINNYDESIRMLDYVVNLMNTQSHMTQNDFGFAVKPIDSEIDDGIVSFGFNRHGIIKIGELHSIQAPTALTDPYNYMVDSFTILGIPYNDYSVEKVYVPYFGSVVELDIEDYISMLNSEWILLQDHNILWSYQQFTEIYRNNNRDLLNNPYPNFRK